MRTNHSPLRFLGLIATASVLASGLYANGAQAATIASTTKANGASASPVLVGSSSASMTGTRNLVDGTRTAVDSNRTSRALRSVTATTATTATATTAAANAAATTGGMFSPTSGPAASGSATSSQQLVQVTAPAAPANAARPMPASQASPVDIGVTPLAGGGNSAGAPTSVTVPPATTTTTAPTDPSPADSAGTPVATQLPARQPAATKAATKESQATPSTTTTAPKDLSPADSAAGTPVATQLSAQQAPATQPAAMKSATTEPQATPSTTTPAVATPPSATGPVATGPVATEPVATEPIAAQSLKAQSASLSPGNRTRRLHQLQILVTRWLRAETDQAAPPVTPFDSLVSPPPSHPSWGLARGPLGSAVGSPRVIAAGADLESGSASVTAAPRRPEEPRSVARPHAAMAPAMPQALSPASTVQTRLPVGGAAAASGGGGSVAPSVVAEFEALAVALATILLVRFSHDRAAWRSILLASRLERPG